ncbi:hypothetical protein [Desulfotruncus arcticus]|uniref:hypothetical protein n=1 Tax=Desulfotruncus arcticus TaxID=341036 RepID=UPI0010422A5C|nr:hypothetical protein [Desulfotruncus arcticus]
MSAKAFLGYGDATLNSVIIDVFTIDSVSVSNTEDGYIKITVTQSSPNSRLSYKVINNNDGRVIATKSGITTSSFSVNDMAPVRGTVN